MNGNVQVNNAISADAKMNNPDHKDASVNTLLQGLKMMMPNIDQKSTENDEGSSKIAKPLIFDCRMMRDLQLEHSNEMNKLKKLTAEIGTSED